jgi:ubiquinone/menaquinone biosynthesis C-methylase UbiE
MTIVVAPWAIPDPCCGPMASLDWSEGEYERTAELLEPASIAAIEAAKIKPSSCVLDLGCGTGNAALQAARLGADVLAIDPSGRLVGVTRKRAESEGLVRVRAEVGDASQIPASDATFDAVVSVFAVIFAPDAERAADEMLRVTKPDGRVVVTSWSPKGPISQAGAFVREAMTILDPSTKTRPAPAWGEPAFVQSLFEARGAKVSIEEKTLSFTSTSAEAWFEEQETHHPIWRGIKRVLLASHPDEWERARTRSLEALRAGNEDPTSFRTTSTYLLVTVTR